MSRPVIVVSACLHSEACRHDGQALRDPVVAALSRHVELRRVCPEVSVGLGVPRDPVRLVERGGAVALLQPATGRDLTAPMRAFADRFLDGAGAVDGFILKGRSPSCGLSQVKVYSPTGPVLRRSHGLFAQAVVDRYPGVAVEEEGRLSDFAIRDHFLTRIFASARLRPIDRPSALVGFHARHKFLLLGHGQAAVRALGREVADAGRLPFGEVKGRYAALFGRALASPARRPSRINVFEHLFGYVSEFLTAREKRHFRAVLDDYRDGRLPVGGVVTLLRSWVERFEVAYLADQVLFEPYPPELVSLLDSGKGRAP